MKWLTETCELRFSIFISKIGHNSPILLASHSQGGFHLNRLLLEVIEKDVQLRERVVAAYIIGSCLPQSLFSNGDGNQNRSGYKFFKMSEEPTDCHSIIGWDTCSNWYDALFPSFHHLFEEWPGHFATARKDQFVKSINIDPLTFRPAVNDTLKSPGPENLHRKRQMVRFSSGRNLTRKTV